MPTTQYGHTTWNNMTQGNRRVILRATGNLLKYSKVNTTQLPKSVWKDIDGWMNTYNR